MKIDNCKDLFETIKEYENYISQFDFGNASDKISLVKKDLKDAVQVISSVIYEVMPPKDHVFIEVLSSENKSDISKLKTSLHHWIVETANDIDVLAKCFVLLDYNFERMMITVERCSEDDLIKRILNILTAFGEQAPSDFNRLISAYSAYAHFWGEFDPASGKFDHFINAIHAVKEHVQDIRWLYNTVEDYRSRKVIYGIVMFWLQLDFVNKNAIKENNFDDYFDLDILKNRMTEDEVFVDCGAFTGDTAKLYLVY